ncbi:hypothetical protein [Radiobacillus sp. PE A8.2]|uniref:hypothetical protein n=1 Tax=Radiobacillus sp. PE A8.2 TaxID=3380349 RepID=UPI0038909E0F
MVSYDCHACGGSGKEEVMQIRAGKPSVFMDNCTVCCGAGTMRNGKPELDFDLGITDPDPVWKKAWGNDYAKERAKGLNWHEFS